MNIYVCYCPILSIIPKTNSFTFLPQPFCWPDLSLLSDLVFDNTSEQICNVSPAPVAKQMRGTSLPIISSIGGQILARHL